MSRGPVVAAYADSDAWSRRCPNPPRGCGAEPESWCRNPISGLPRAVPCLARSRPTPDELRAVESHSGANAGGSSPEGEPE